MAASPTFDARGLASQWTATYFQKGRKRRAHRERLHLDGGARVGGEPEAEEFFGNGQRLFLNGETALLCAHVFIWDVCRKGDFDQVVSAQIRGHEFTDDELRHGVTMRFTGKANTAASRLVEGKAVSGTANVADAKVAVEVVPTREFYMSERDLA